MLLQENRQIVIYGSNLANNVKRKAKTKSGRYEVFTRRDLNEPDRPVATRLLKTAIVLSMAGILLALRRPLIEAVTSLWPLR